MRLLRFLGFRYSMSRDAYILRLVGGRFGPVLRPQGEPPAKTEPIVPARADAALDHWDQPTVAADDAWATRHPDREYAQR